MYLCWNSAYDVVSIIDSATSGTGLVCQNLDDILDPEKLLEYYFYNSISLKVLVANAVTSFRDYCWLMVYKKPSSTYVEKILSNYLASQNRSNIMKQLSKASNYILAQNYFN